jgi:hypothetical protein
MDEHVSIQYRTNVEDEWTHGKSVPAWAMEDRDSARIQRAHVRSVVREEFGKDSKVFLRVVDADEWVVG